MGMENININSIFTAFKGSGNISLSNELSLCKEGDSKYFLNVLNDVINAGCLKGNTTETGPCVASWQSCMQDADALPPNLLQLISNTKINTGIVSSDFSQQQANEKEDNGNAEDNNINKIDFAGADADSIKAVLPLLKSISEALAAKETVKLNLTGIVSENTAENTDTSAKADLPAGKDIRTSSAEMPLLPLLKNIFNNIDLKKADADSIKAVLPLLKSISEALAASDNLSEKVKKEDFLISSHQSLENDVIIEPSNKIYLSPEWFISKETQSNVADINISKEKVSAECFVHEMLNKESNVYSVLSGNAKQRYLDNIDNDMCSNIEIFPANFTGVIKHEGSSKREVSFTGYQQTGSDYENVQTPKDGMQSFFVQSYRKSDESIITQTKEVINLQNKDLKILFKENDYPLLTNQEHFENAIAQEVQDNKGLNEAQFKSHMTEKIEKVIEQYSSNGTSADMVVRLKINDKDTVLVGLKNDGQKIMVDVKTTSEGVMNILQNQKDSIIRNLEEKNIYTNIFVDPDGNGSFERRETKREHQRNPKETAKQKDFIELLETV
jgi:hypothetical protein